MTPELSCKIDVKNKSNEQIKSEMRECYSQKAEANRKKRREIREAAEQKERKEELEKTNILLAQADVWKSYIPNINDKNRVLNQGNFNYSKSRAEAISRWAKKWFNHWDNLLTNIWIRKKEKQSSKT